MKTLKLIDLVEHVNKLGLNVSFDEDLEGQIVIFTGMKINDQEELVQFDCVESNEDL